MILSLTEQQLKDNLPFYKRHLENYLGSSYSDEMYNSLLDEVCEDVERRIKELIS